MSPQPSRPKTFSQGSGSAPTWAGPWEARAASPPPRVVFRSHKHSQQQPYSSHYPEMAGLTVPDLGPHQDSYQPLLGLQMQQEGSGSAVRCCPSTPPYDAQPLLIPVSAVLFMPSLLPGCMLSYHSPSPQNKITPPPFKGQLSPTPSKKPPLNAPALTYFPLHPGAALTPTVNPILLVPSGQVEKILLR